MKEPSHTPGPWEIIQTIDGFYIDAQKKGYSVTVAEINKNPGGLQIKANARLIAAAPEMYAELLRIVRYGYDATHDNERVSKILAKAEGRA